MSKKKILDTLAPNRFQVYINEAHKTGKNVVQNIEDTTPLLKVAQQVRDLQEYEGQSKEFRHAAFVPHFVYDQWLRDAKAAGHPGVIEPKVIKSWCNNPDNAMFRTWPGEL